MAPGGGNDVPSERRGAVVAFRSSSVMEGPFPCEDPYFASMTGQMGR